MPHINNGFLGQNCVVFGVQLACSSQQECIVPLLYLTKPICNGKLFAAVVPTAIAAPTDNNSSKQQASIEGCKQGHSANNKISFAHTSCRRVSAEGTLKSIQSDQVTVVPQKKPKAHRVLSFPRQKECGLGTRYSTCILLDTMTWFTCGCTEVKAPRFEAPEWRLARTQESS